MKISKGTIIRTAVLGIAIINQIVTVVLPSGNPLLTLDPAVEDQVATALTAITAIAAWWKNNSFTLEAVQADKHLKTLREMGSKK